MDVAESETLVPATPEETWEAITDPERMADWLAEDAEIELVPGGDIRVDERDGFVEEVDRPNRFVFWWHEDDGESSRVEIDLVPEPDGTRVRVVESRPLRELAADDARSPELCAIA